MADRITLLPEPLGPTIPVMPRRPISIRRGRLVRTSRPSPGDPDSSGETRTRSRDSPGSSASAGSRLGVGAPPAPRSSTRSIAASSPEFWVAQSMASPRARSSDRIARAKRRLSASMCAVASSASSTAGDAASAAPSSTICCRPADSRRGSRSSSAASPKRSATSPSRRPISSSLVPRLRGPKASSSRTVGWSSWLEGSCWITASRRRAAGSAPRTNARPSKQSSPEAGHRPASPSSRLVLPDPLGPARPTHSPWASARD